MTGSRVFKLVLGLTLALPLLFFSARSVVFDWYHVPSGAMLPTIVPGTTGIGVLKCAYQVRLPFTSRRLVTTGAPVRGDIVVLRNPDGKATPFITRVVGLPGDVIELRNEALIINGKPLPLTFDEPRLGSNAQDEIIGHTTLFGRQFDILILPSIPALRNFGPITVPPGEAFVLGDNRDRSRDSRFFGTRPIADLLGRVVFIPPRA